MAALSITVADVRLGSNVKIIEATAGETVTPMMPLYKHSDGEYRKAANTSAVLAECKGIVFGPGQDGGRIILVQSGLITLGATLAINTAYCVGASGLIMPYDDLSSGEFGTFLGWATTAAVLDLQIRASGVATP